MTESYYKLKDAKVFVLTSVNSLPNPFEIAI